jgi:hypothetical protein
MASEAGQVGMRDQRPVKLTTQQQVAIRQEAEAEARDARDNVPIARVVKGQDFPRAQIGEPPMVVVPARRLAHDETGEQRV